jgi:D-alanyl-D-alanine carboxypeptidase
MNFISFFLKRLSAYSLISTVYGADEGSFPEQAADGSGNADPDKRVGLSGADINEADTYEDAGSVGAPVKDARTGTADDAGDDVPLIHKGEGFEDADSDIGDVEDVDPVNEIPLVPGSQRSDEETAEIADNKQSMLTRIINAVKYIPASVLGVLKNVKRLKPGAKNAADPAKSDLTDAMSKPLDIGGDIADATPEHAPSQIPSSAKKKHIKKTNVKKDAEKKPDVDAGGAPEVSGAEKTEKDVDKKTKKKAKKTAAAEDKKAKKAAKNNKKKKNAAGSEDDSQESGKKKKKQGKKKDPKAQKEKNAKKAAKKQKKAENKKPKLTKEEKIALKFEKEQAKHEKKLAKFERHATKIEAKLNKKSEKKEALLERKNEKKAQKREFVDIKKTRRLEIKKQREYWLERGVGRVKRRVTRVLAAILMLTLLTGGGVALYKSQLIPPYNNLINIAANSPLKVIPAALDKPVKYIASCAGASIVRLTEIIKGKPKLEDLYYFEADKAERYAAFQEAHPDMPVDEIAWRVNAGADLFLYEDPIAISDFSIKPLVVNKFNNLSPVFKPTNLVFIPGTQMQADKDAYAAFERMQQDAALQNINLSVASAYRSFEYQSVLYNPSVGDTRENLQSRIARPGFSEHQTGLAFDVAVTGGRLSEFEGSPEEEWLKRNAEKYGFMMRYTKELEDVTGFRDEPWHIRYVGGDLITSMKENNIKTLEEYKVKFIDHKPGDTPEKQEKDDLGKENTNGPI